MLHSQHHPEKMDRAAKYLLSAGKECEPIESSDKWKRTSIGFNINIFLFFFQLHFLFQGNCRRWKFPSCPTMTVEKSMAAQSQTTTYVPVQLKEERALVLWVSKTPSYNCITTLRCTLRCNKRNSPLYAKMEVRCCSLHLSVNVLSFQITLALMSLSTSKHNCQWPFIVLAGNCTQVACSLVITSYFSIGPSICFSSVKVSSG